MIADANSRKFILTLVYAAIFVVNYAFTLNIPWESMLSLAVMFGVYNVANAVEGQARIQGENRLAEVSLYTAAKNDEVCE